MDKQIGVLFERVEKALTSLIDTMAKYNPSTHQAHELVAAEAELAKGLDDLQTHQQNHARILHLRGVSQQLDQQIKGTVVMLAKARKELVSTPATEFPDGPSNTIRYHELLAYASRISKTTMPPSGALNPALSALQQFAPPDSGLESAAPTPGGTPNGMASAAPTPSANPPAHPLDPASQETQMSSTGPKAIPEHIRSHMNPYTGMLFAPWPHEDAIRSGALANLSYLHGEGINPEGYDPAEEEARKKREEEAAREREEQARLEQEAKDRRMREEWERQRAEREKARAEAAERQRQGSDADPSAGGEPASAAPKPPGEKKQFQFMGADDDDESD